MQFWSMGKNLSAQSLFLALLSGITPNNVQEHYVLTEIEPSMDTSESNALLPVFSVWHHQVYFIVWLLYFGHHDLSANNFPSWRYRYTIYSRPLTPSHIAFSPNLFTLPLDYFLSLPKLWVLIDLQMPSVPWSSFSIYHGYVRPFNVSLFFMTYFTLYVHPSYIKLLI